MRIIPVDHFLIGLFICVKGTDVAELYQLIISPNPDDAAVADVRNTECTSLKANLSEQKSKSSQTQLSSSPFGILKIYSHVTDAKAKLLDRSFHFSLVMVVFLYLNGPLFPCTGSVQARSSLLRVAYLTISLVSRWVAFRVS